MTSFEAELDVLVTRAEVLDRRAVNEAVAGKYLPDYVSRGAIADIGYRSTLGEGAYDFGVARDGSVWLEWPLAAMTGESKPFVLVDNAVRLCAYAVELWNESSIRTPRGAFPQRVEGRRRRAKRGARTRARSASGRRVASERASRGGAKRRPRRGERAKRPRRDSNPCYRRERPVS